MFSPVGMNWVPPVDELCSCRPCLCLFSFIYTLRCTLCVRRGWHDSNIHKLTNAQQWSGTSTLWKDAKQKTIPRVSVSDFDTVDARNSKKWLLPSVLFPFQHRSLILFYKPDFVLTNDKKKKMCWWNSNESLLCTVFIHELFISRRLGCLFPPVCQRVVITQPIACMHTLIRWQWQPQALQGVNKQK